VSEQRTKPCLAAQENTQLFGGAIPSEDEYRRALSLVYSRTFDFSELIGEHVFIPFVVRSHQRSPDHRLVTRRRIRLVMRLGAQTFINIPSVVRTRRISSITRSTTRGRRRALTATTTTRTASNSWPALTTTKEKK
jgi:hypothetical protein